MKEDPSASTKRHHQLHPDTDKRICEELVYVVVYGVVWRGH